MTLTPQMRRAEVTAARRVVVKIGSSSLTSTAGGIDPGRVRRLAEVLAGARAGGMEVVLVSSGAIAAGLAPLRMKRRPKALPAQQAAASVGQGLLVHRYTEELARHGVVAGQVLLTVDDVTRRSHYRNAYQTFAKLLELGVLPIVNENDTVATTEIRFGDNDRLAALVAHLVHADLLVLLSDVDGLYDAAPGTPGSSLLTEVRDPADLAGVRVGKAGDASLGTGGMRTKLEAARIATGAGIPVVLTSADNVADALAGEPVGTLFHTTGRRRPTRLLWLAHATEPAGTLLLDPGAVAAVTQRRASLLAAGVTGVVGTFQAGDPVDIADPDGVAIARGLVNFDSTELPSLLGRSTSELKRELGAAYEREVVHRDDLVLL
jgi:glutamate 5-kinase